MASEETVGAEGTDFADPAELNAEGEAASSWDEYKRDPSHTELKHFKGRSGSIAISGVPGDTVTINVRVERTGYDPAEASATYTIKKISFAASSRKNPINPDETAAKDKDEKDGYIYSDPINVGEDSYVVKYTEAVSYNGIKHIEAGGRGGKSKAADVEVIIIKNVTETISSGYKVKFKNNQYVNGYKGKSAPSFTLTWKGKANKALKAAFKGKSFSFSILPAELIESKLSVKKALVKNGRIKLSGLKYSGGSKAVKLKPQKGSKGDYAATVSDNSIILTGVNNFYGTAVIPAQVSEPKEKEEKEE